MKKAPTKGLVVTIALVVVFGFFGRELFGQLGAKAPSFMALDWGQFDLVAQSGGQASPIEHELWQTFLAYRTYAKEHNLQGLNSLTYKLSPTCASALAGDQAKVKECNSLMDSIYFFTQDFVEKDFVNIAYNDKQAIISTDYLKPSPDFDQVKTVLYFVLESHQAKLAGLRFCFGTETTNEPCVVTNPNQRDSNHNGWWDDIEYFLNR